MNEEIKIPVTSGVIEVTPEGYFIDSSYLEALANSRNFGEFLNSGSCGTPVCKPVPINCRVCWGATYDCDTRELTISVVNSTPLNPLTFRIKLPHGIYDVQMVTDSRGTAQRQIEILSGAGSYTVTPINAYGCSLIPGNYCFDIKEKPCNPCDPCEIRTEISAVECDVTSRLIGTPWGSEEDYCSEAVIVTPEFLSPSVASGYNTTLRIRVKNSNNRAVQFSMPTLVLPSGLYGTVKVEPTRIEALSEVDFTFQITAAYGDNTTLQVVISNGMALYTCEGSQYSASGGQAGILVTPGMGAPCSLVIESFSWIPSNPKKNENVQLCLVLKNTGTTNLTDIIVPVITPPTGFTGGVIQSNTALIAAGASVSICTSGVFNNTGTDEVSHDLTIPANSISYKCSGMSMRISQERKTTVTVDPKAVDAGTCAGKLNVVQNQALGTSSCELKLVLEDGPKNWKFKIEAHSGGINSTIPVTANSTEIQTDSSGNAEVVLAYMAFVASANLAFTLRGENNCKIDYQNFFSCTYNEGSTNGGDSGGGE